MNMNRLIPPPDCDLATWLSSVVYDAIRDAKTAGLSDSDASVLLDIIARNTRDSRSVDVRTPKLDAEIDRVNRERVAEGLHPLTGSKRHKAIAQLSAERVIEFAKSRGMQTSASTLDMIAWLILEPVIEDEKPKP